MAVNTKERTIMQMLEEVISNPKVGHTVATVTAGVGLAETLDLIKSGLSIVAIIIGITLSAVLLIKNYHEYRIAKTRRLEEVLERKAKGLPIKQETKKARKYWPKGGASRR